MKKIIKLTALILSVLMVLTACTLPPPDDSQPEDYGTAEEKESLIRGAEDALLSSVYGINVSFGAECDSPEHAEDVAALFGSATVNVLRHGDNFKITLPTAAGAATVLLYSNTAYVSAMDVEAMELVLVKAPLTDGQRFALVDALPTEPRITVKDFATTVLTKEGRLVCTDITASVYEELFESGMPDGVERVVVDGAKMELSFKDGKYDTVTLTYDLNVRMAGTDISVAVTTAIAYSYGTAPLTIPENGQSYKTTNYDIIAELLGIQ